MCAPTTELPSNTGTMGSLYLQVQVDGTASRTLASDRMQAWAPSSHPASHLHTSRMQPGSGDWP